MRLRLRRQCFLWSYPKLLRQARVQGRCLKLEQGEVEAPSVESSYRLPQLCRVCCLRPPFVFPATSLASQLIVPNTDASNPREQLLSYRNRNLYRSHTKTRYLYVFDYARTTHQPHQNTGRITKEALRTAFATLRQTPLALHCRP